MPNKTTTEAARLVELRKFDFLFEGNRADLERLCAITRQLFDCEKAAICLVDEDVLRELSSTTGSAIDAIPAVARESSITNLTIAQNGLLEIEDISQDERFGLLS